MTRHCSRTSWPLVASLATVMGLGLIAPREWLITAEPVSVMVPHTSAPLVNRGTPPTDTRAAAPVVQSARRDVPRADFAPFAPAEPTFVVAASAEESEESAVDPLIQAPPEPPAGDAGNEIRSRSNPLRSDSQTASTDSIPLGPPRPAAERTSNGAIANDAVSIVDRAPLALLDQLEVLAAAPATSDWGRVTIRCVNALGRRPLGPDRQTAQLLAEMRELTKQADAQAVRMQDAAEATDVRRAQYALTRQWDVWEQAYLRPFVAAPAKADAKRLAAQIAQVENIPPAPRDEPLRDFLQLDALRNAAGRSTGTTTEEHRSLARRVLGRIAQISLPNGPRRAGDEKALAGLRDELQNWAAEPVSPEQLLSWLEQFERLGTPRAARALAETMRQVSTLPDPAAKELVNRIEFHYRNANIRTVMSETLLNRFVPAPNSTTEAVRDVIAGAAVSGQSTTLTRLAVKFVPDAASLRLNLEATGTVKSDTSSASGPARFHSDGESTFTAQKTVRVGLDGVQVDRAKANADSSNQLRSVKTNYDVVPLVGGLVRSVARSQYDQKRGEARAEVEEKVATQARERLDAEADRRLLESRQEFERRVVVPLKKLELNPRPMSLSTTEQRIIMRLRLAADEQMAAFTPRPQAPSDSVASLQIHQSAINNALDQLHLAGKAFTAPELQRYLAERLNMPQLLKLNDIPDDVTVKFADHDPILVSCTGGKLVLSVSVAELSNEKNSFQNFTAKVMYHAEPLGLQAGLARDSTMELIGEKLNTRTQAALRGLLAKLFPRERRLQLLPEDWTSDPRLKDLGISQFVIEDGWIGVAVSPTRTAARPTTSATKDPRG